MSKKRISGVCKALVVAAAFLTGAQPVFAVSTISLVTDNVITDDFNLAKGGSTIPVKFEVFNGETEVKDVTQIAIGASEVACPGILFFHPVDTEIEATGNTGLRYDETEGNFVFNWKTPRQSNQCYAFSVDTADGASLDLYFVFK